MPKFRIDATLVCLVTWTYEIEAADHDDAEQAYWDGECYSPIGPPQVMDVIGAPDVELNIKEIPNV